jgi:hypothetical protein
MMKRARLVAAALAVVLAAALPATAAAHTTYKNTPAAALRDCEAGHYPLKGHYTIKVLQKALKRLDSYGAQYTNCGDVILAAIDKIELAQHGSHAGGSNTATVRASTRGVKPKAGGTGKHGAASALPVILPGTGETVTPGAVSIRGASFLSSLPTPLLAVLAALLAALLAVSARAINTLVRARRSH